MKKTKVDARVKRWRAMKAKAWLRKNYNALTVLIFAPICVFVFLSAADMYFAYESYWGTTYRIMTAMALLTMSVSIFGLWIVERLYYISVSKANDGERK